MSLGNASCKPVIQKSKLVRSKLVEESRCRKAGDSQGINISRAQESISRVFEDHGE